VQYQLNIWYLPAVAAAELITMETKAVAVAVPAHYLLELLRL
jgi:hypothetical protein